MDKTNCLRILDKQNVKYEAFSYETKKFNNAFDTIEALNLDPLKVFKTIVTYPNLKSNNHDYYVFVINANDNLDLKKCARLVNEKSLDLINLNDLLKITGYMRGGCSPIGMKKEYKTYFDEDILKHEYVYVSGGKVGLQIKINPKELIRVSKGNVGEIK